MTHAHLPAMLAQRTQALCQAFARIQRERMDGVPMLNQQLQVQAVGFELQPQSDDSAGPPMALGVLVTPWFMNLIRLPLQAGPVVSNVGPLPPGTNAPRDLGAQTLDFIGAHEPLLGDGAWAQYELCSLYSPMFEFADQAAAVATAHEVLRLLRLPPAQPVVVPAPASAPPQPARRGFLLGRSAGGAPR